MQVIGNSWDRVLQDEYGKSYFAALECAVRNAYATSAVYPPAQQIFRAFELCDYSSVRVVILGQDPYHGKGQANGLAFSVGSETALPPSLVNIYTEIESEYGRRPQTGDLTAWAVQGVLLLNTALTVEADCPASHARFGWHMFTDAVIQACSDRAEPLVFLLWGAHAGQKRTLIDTKKHLVLCAPHPSPLSAYRGFFGCGHFRSANRFLEELGKSPIDWVH